MKQATRLSVATTTVFYMLCGCMGYAAPSGCWTSPTWPSSCTSSAPTRSSASPSSPSSS
uniref:Amino acid transporter transmembrane domain-containing protein n=1 Tax=Aegilops tauschii subsp. strangulata TaxID=200361 RepID=A0A453K6P1_AEGTS